MSTIDPKALLSQIGKAGLAAVGAQWPAMRDFASEELSKIAETALQIELDKKNGAITEDEAKTLVEMKENTLRTVWLTIDGMTDLTEEAAVNAVMGVVKSAINTATGFALL